MEVAVWHYYEKGNILSAAKEFSQLLRKPKMFTAARHYAVF
jgi:hypothetical protein